MDELLYLSRSKLNSFVERPGRLAIGKAEGGFKLFGAEANLAVEKHGLDQVESGYRRLAKVQKSLLNSDRWPRWFEDEAVGSGDWVSFELSLTWKRFDVTTTPVMIFGSPGRRAESAILLLHGSPSSMMPGRETVSESGLETGSSISSIGAFLSAVGDNASVDRGDALHQDGFALGAAETLKELRGSAIAYPMVEGWARVTAQLNIRDNEARARVVLASPLYIRYSEGLQLP